MSPQDLEPVFIRHNPMASSSKNLQSNLLFIPIKLINGINTFSCLAAEVWVVLADPHSLHRVVC